MTEKILDVVDEPNPKYGKDSLGIQRHGDSLASFILGKAKKHPRISRESALAFLACVITLLGISACGSSDSSSPEVPDNTPPTIVIAQPGANQVVFEAVEVTCLVTDNVGVDRVELWVDGVASGIIDRSDPYVLMWDTVPFQNGSTHVLTARAHDTSENVNDSNPVNVITDQSQAVPSISEISRISISGPAEASIHWEVCPDDDFDHYEVFRRTGSGEFSLLETVNDQNTTNMDIPSIDPFADNYFRLDTYDVYNLHSSSQEYHYCAKFSFSLSDNPIREPKCSITQDFGTVVGFGITQGSTDGIQLVKVDSGGSEIWRRTFEGSLVHQVIETSDGGFAIAGTATNGDALFIKTDSYGTNPVSATFASGTDAWWTPARSIVETPDGGFALFCQLQSDYSVLGGWILKVDVQGNLLWSRQNDHSPTLSDGPQINLSSDGGFYIIGGSTLARLDEDGYQMWEQTLGQGLEAFQVLSDGHLVFVFNNDVLLKTDSNGQTIWTQSLTGSFDSLMETADGGFILGGGFSGTSGIVKTNAQGSEQWRRSFSSNSSWTSGGYVLELGYQGYTFVLHGEESFLLGLDENGMGNSN